MKASRLIANGLLIVFALGLFTLQAPAAQDTKKDEKKQEEKIFIPKEIKAIIQEGLAARQGRQDIPFTIIRHYMFPASQNFHSVFLFKAKNADLGFAPAIPAGQAPAEPQKEGQPAAPAPPLRARLNVFLQFLALENNVPGKVIREVYVPLMLQEEAASFVPDKEEWYTTGYPLPAGQYLLAMAIASFDLKRVGVVYREFALPDPASFQNSLETTPIFFAKKIDQMPQAEMKTEVHKGYFTYSILQIVPNVDSIVAPGESIEVFYFIFGAKTKGEPGQQPKFEIEANYEVFQGEKTAIKWGASSYDYPLVSQPLHLKQTVKITDDKGERTEQRNLEPGAYVLVIKLKDKVSGVTVEKRVDFEVK